ncbi:hypothetical protein OC709_02205 ['Planchonia careya' phytoplasma]|nr:hypothetical protein ['Planchonia careya' phytoplasma]MDO8030311.1 hypothetical protein ['Planchonia careya' phytoplasma]
MSLETEFTEKFIDFNKQVRNHKTKFEKCLSKKAVYNFHDAQVISSLTLAHHNQDG